MENCHHLEGSSSKHLEIKGISWWLCHVVMLVEWFVVYFFHQQFIAVSIYKRSCRKILKEKNGAN